MGEEEEKAMPAKEEPSLEDSSIPEGVPTFSIHTPVAGASGFSSAGREDEHMEGNMPSADVEGVICGGCGMSPLVGSRFKCRTCPAYDLCTECHVQRHDFHDP